MNPKALAMADMSPVTRRKIRGEKPVSSHLPYTHFVDADIVCSVDGMLMLTIHFSGLSMETADQSELNDRQAQRAHVFRTITSPDIWLYYHFVRRRDYTYLDGEFESEFAAQLDQAWGDRLRENCSFRNDHYITLCAKPRASVVKKKFGRETATISKQAYAEALQRLRESANLALSSLSEYQPRIVRVSDDMLSSEALSLFSFFATGDWRAIAPPRMNLSKAIATKRISFGRETVEMRGVTDSDTRYAAILGLREYPGILTARTLEELNGVSAEFVLTQTFAPEPNDKALNAIKKQQARMYTAEDSAVSLTEMLDHAKDEVASQRMTFGQHHISLTVYSDTPKGITHDLGLVRSICANAGLTVAREDTNIEPAFWAMAPGNFVYAKGRVAMINNDNLGAFIALGSPQEGEVSSKWGPAITMFPTTAMTPYKFNFHVEDVGNTVVFGPTGAGKTALLCFLIAQADRVRPRIIVMDKDRGAEILIRAIGGEYATLNPGQEAGLNPFLIDDGPEYEDETRAFLTDWVAALLFGDQADQISPSQKAALTNGVNELRDVPPGDRRLDLLQQVLGGGPDGPDLLDRLKKWIGNGDKAWAFNSLEDRFSNMFERRVMGIDLTKILEDKQTSSAWMLYLFNRIEHALRDGLPTLIVLDEAWRILGDGLFASRIQNWMKVIRKLNGAVIFATQEPEDPLATAVGKTVIQQSPTQILLRNPRADEKAYCEGLRISEYELTLIRTLPKAGRHLMIRRDNNSVLVSFDMTGMPEFIDVLSSRAETVLEMDRLRESEGDAWLAEFMTRRVLQ